MANSGFLAGSNGTVSAVFFTKKDADNVYNALIKRGHTPDDISVLMSDETLSRHETQEVQTSDDPEKPESAVGKASDVIADAIISITSMISLPELGIAISRTLFKRISTNKSAQAPHENDHENASRVVEEHTEFYGDHMKEGGIIISVDPRNLLEKRAIVKDFRLNNGHDILGDDGYTELD